MEQEAVGAMIWVLGAVLASPGWEISGLPVNAALREFLEPHKAEGCDQGGCVGAAHSLWHPAQYRDASGLVHCLQLAGCLAQPGGAWNVLARGS